MRKVIFGIVGCLMLFGAAYAAQLGDWQDYSDDPRGILTNVIGETNEDFGIQQTELNNVQREEGGYPAQYTVTNTLDSIRQRIAPYLQWIIFIGLALAVIFIIYNGLLMVTGSLHSQGERSAVQKRLLSLIIGVLIITGFYFIIRLIVILTNSLAQ